MNVINPYRLAAWSPDVLESKLVGWFDASVDDTLHSSINLGGGSATAQGFLNSWQDVRGKFSGGYGYLNIYNPSTIPARTGNTLESTIGGAGDAINGINGVTLFTDTIENNSPKYITQINESSPSDWQPFGIDSTPYNAIGFHFALRALSPLDALDRGTIIQSSEAGQPAGGPYQRILSHHPWLDTRFIWDAGSSFRGMRSTNNRYAAESYPFQKDVITSLYAVNPLPSAADQSTRQSERYISVNGDVPPYSVQTPSAAAYGTFEEVGTLGPAFWLGYGSGGQNECTLGELLITEGILSIEERQAIEGYLGWKWNGSTTSFTDEFSSNHPWKYSPPII